MSDFLKDYKTWEFNKEKGKKQIIVDCASFYEEKALDYILANMPKAKQKEFKQIDLSTLQSNKNIQKYTNEDSTQFSDLSKFYIN